MQTPVPTPPAPTAATGTATSATALPTTELTPPQLPAFELEPPAAVPAVPAESASGRVRLSETEVTRLDEQVTAFIGDITSVGSQDPRFKEAVARVHSMGNREIEQSASVSNRLLERPVRTMQSGVFDNGSTIGRSLIDLRRKVEELDPSRQGDLLTPKKLFGILPFGDRLRDYFDQYRSSQDHLNAIVESLKRGKDELMRDNAVIEQEKANLWGLMERLEKYIHIGRRLDRELEARLPALEAQDAEKARVVREEMLFYTRQKVMDLLTQMSVNVQGYLALDMVRKNNLELMKGVDRATTTTVSALRTAVVVAQALANQKLVLDQISALNTTTGNLIESTSEMLKTQSASIHQQAASSTIEMAKLQRAFQNVYATMDAISDYKTKALVSMQATVDSLGAEVEKAKTYVDRVRREEAAAATATPVLADGDVRL